MGPLIPNPKPDYENAPANDFSPLNELPDELKNVIFSKLNPEAALNLRKAGASYNASIVNYKITDQLNPLKEFVEKMKQSILGQNHPEIYAHCKASIENTKFEGTNSKEIKKQLKDLRNEIVNKIKDNNGIKDCSSMISSLIRTQIEKPGDDTSNVMYFYCLLLLTQAYDYIDKLNESKIKKESDVAIPHYRDDILCSMVNTLREFNEIEKAKIILDEIKDPELKVQAAKQLTALKVTPTWIKRNS
jgi:hypothetical protein